jgi:GAF domain-containing protein
VTDAEKRQGEARKAAAEKARETFLEEMMTRIKAVLEVASKRRIALSLMRLDGDDLVIKFVCPKYDKDLDSNLKLRLGQGGAGVAYRDGIPVYIPSTHHLVGINLKTSAPTGETYKAATEKKEDKKEAYRSLLCVPVFGGNGIVGVLNVSSSKRASFYPLDFKIAKLAAALVSIVS